MLERFRINRQNFGRKCNVRNEFPKLPQKQRKVVPSKPDDFRDMLKITHVRDAKQGTQKNKKSLGFLSVFLRTKINLLEILVGNRLPKIFLNFFKNLVH